MFPHFSGSSRYKYSDFEMLLVEVAEQCVPDISSIGERVENIGVPKFAADNQLFQSKWEKTLRQ